MGMSLFNRYTKEQKAKAEQIAGEQISLGRSMEVLKNNSDFVKVFIDFRRDKFIPRARKALDNAILDENEEAIKECEKRLRQLITIDWFIDYVTSYISKGENLINSLEEE